MSTNPRCTVYVGNLDEKVPDRVLYDILIQAGRVVDLYIPRDRETDKPKGYAFAEYETEEIADYAVRLFSGLVTLCGRTLKFAISGQDKPSVNASGANLPNTSHTQRAHPLPVNNSQYSRDFYRLPSSSYRSAPYPEDYSDVPLPPGVDRQPNGNGSRYESRDHGYTQRVFPEISDGSGHSRSRHYDTSRPVYYPSY